MHPALARCERLERYRPAHLRLDQSVYRAAVAAVPRVGALPRRVARVGPEARVAAVILIPLETVPAVTVTGVACVKSVSRLHDEILLFRGNADLVIARPFVGLSGANPRLYWFRSSCSIWE